MRSTPSARVHRVFHRIGVVVGGLLVVIALIVGATGLYAWASGYDEATNVADVTRYYYPAPVERNGLVHYDNQTATREVFLLRENALRAAQYRRDNAAARDWTVGLLVAGLAIYGLLRALGWIVAGAMPE